MGVRRGEMSECGYGEGWKSVFDVGRWTYRKKDGRNSKRSAGRGRSALWYGFRINSRYQDLTMAKTRSGFLE